AGDGLLRGRGGREEAEVEERAGVTYLPPTTSVVVIVVVVSSEIERRGWSGGRRRPRLRARGGGGSWVRGVREEMDAEVVVVLTVGGRVHSPPSPCLRAAMMGMVAGERVVASEWWRASGGGRVVAGEHDSGDEGDREGGREREREREGKGGEGRRWEGGGGRASSEGEEGNGRGKGRNAVEFQYGNSTGNFQAFVGYSKFHRRVIYFSVSDSIGAQITMTRPSSFPSALSSPHLLLSRPLASRFPPPLVSSLLVSALVAAPSPRACPCRRAPSPPSRPRVQAAPPLLPLLASKPRPKPPSKGSSPLQALLKSKPATCLTSSPRRARVETTLNPPAPSQEHPAGEPSPPLGLSALRAGFAPPHDGRLRDAVSS
ncbi:hypothetical protein CONPUDRAFT_160577, partial [Coniophora puteana RWD-64-598 SS2]